MRLIRRAMLLTIVLMISGVVAGQTAAASSHVAGTQVRSHAGGGKVTIKEIDDKYHFVPATITVQVGATVTWTNSSDAPHTVTSDTGAFDTKQFGEDQTVSLTFSNPGTFSYHCSVHPYMHGMVMVQAAANAGGGPSAPAAMPRTGAGGTASSVSRLPRTGGTDAPSRLNAMNQLAPAGLLGLVLILAGLGMRHRVAQAPTRSICK